MALVDAAIDTTTKRVLYREFIIIDVGEFWEWTHQDYWVPGCEGYGVGDGAFSLYEAIEAVEAWYDSQEEAA